VGECFWVGWVERDCSPWKWLPASGPKDTLWSIEAWCGNMDDSYEKILSMGYAILSLIDTWWLIGL